MKEKAKRNLSDLLDTRVGDIVAGLQIQAITTQLPLDCNEHGRLPRALSPQPNRTIGQMFFVPLLQTLRSFFDPGTRLRLVQHIRRSWTHQEMFVIDALRVIYPRGMTYLLKAQGTRVAPVPLLFH